MVSISDLIRDSQLPRHEAERLLVVASGLTRADLVTAGDLPGDVVAQFDELVGRRRSGTPLQYLEGTVQFGPLELKADSRALIPRPETERLWERVVELVGDAEPEVIVDLCTGSGNLALALKHVFPTASVYATDISAAALELATENAARTGLDVTWLEGDLFAPLPVEVRGAVDVLVANPPYIAGHELDELQPDVRDHEPIAALISGPEGDEALAAIAASAIGWLRPGGLIACEIGADQGERARLLFVPYGGVVEADLAGRDRFVFGRRRIN